MSVVVGVAGGVLAARAIAAAADQTVRLSLSVVVAYGTYLLAEAAGLSGILATVLAGIVMGTRMRREERSRALAREIADLWEVIAFVLTSLVFLLIGFAIAVPSLFGATTAIALGTAAVLAARAFNVYVPTLLARLRRRAAALPRGWSHVIVWSGLRGAIALAAALSLPADFPRRELVQETCFGIVLATLLVQGGTAPLVVRWAIREPGPATALRSRREEVRPL